MTDAMTADALIERFSDAVRANGYRTRSDATEREFEEARKELRAALTRLERAEAQPDRAELIDALKGLVRTLDAVKFSAGLGKTQLDRLNAAKSLLDRAALTKDTSNDSATPANGRGE